MNKKMKKGITLLTVTGSLLIPVSSLVNIPTVLADNLSTGSLTQEQYDAAMARYNQAMKQYNADKQLYDQRLVEIATKQQEKQAAEAENAKRKAAYEAEYQEYQKKLAEYSAQQEAYQQKIKEVVEKNNATIAKNKASKDKFDLEMADYQQKLADYRQQLAEYQEKHDTVSQEILRLKAEYQAALAQYHQDEAAYKQKKATYDEALQTYQQQEANYQAELATYQNKKSTYEQELAAYQQEVLDYQRAEKGYQEKLNLYNEALQNKKNVEETIAKNKKQYEEKLAQYKQDEQKYKDDLAKYTDKEVPEFEKELEELSKWQAKVTKIDEKYQEDLATYQQELAQYQKDLVTYSKDLETYNQAMADKKAAVEKTDQLNQEYQQALANYNEAQKQYETAEKAYRDAEKSVASANNKATTANQQSENLKQKLTDLTQSYKKQLEKTKLAENQLPENLKSEFDTAITELEKATQAFKEKADLASTDATTYQAALTSYQETLTKVMKGLPTQPELVKSLTPAGGTSLADYQQSVTEYLTKIDGFIAEAKEIAQKNQLQTKNYLEIENAVHKVNTASEELTTAQTAINDNINRAVAAGKANDSTAYIAEISTFEKTSYPTYNDRYPKYTQAVDAYNALAKQAGLPTIDYQEMEKKKAENDKLVPGLINYSSRILTYETLETTYQAVKQAQDAIKQTSYTEVEDLLAKFNAAIEAANQADMSEKTTAAIAQEGEKLLGAIKNAQSDEGLTGLETYQTKLKDYQNAIADYQKKGGETKVSVDLGQVEKAIQDEKDNQTNLSALQTKVQTLIESLKTTGTVANMIAARDQARDEIAAAKDFEETLNGTIDRWNTFYKGIATQPAQWAAQEDEIVNLGDKVSADYGEYIKKMENISAAIDQYNTKAEAFRTAQVGKAAAQNIDLTGLEKGDKDTQQKIKVGIEGLDKTIKDFGEYRKSFLDYMQKIKKSPESNTLRSNYIRDVQKPEIVSSPMSYSDVPNYQYIRTIFAADYFDNAWVTTENIGNIIQNEGARTYSLGNVNSEILPNGVVDRTFSKIQQIAIRDAIQKNYLKI